MGADQNAISHQTLLVFGALKPTPISEHAMEQAREELRLARLEYEDATRC